MSKTDSLTTIQHTRQMAYVPNNYKVNMNQLHDILANLRDNEINWETLLMVDYVYYNRDPNYDNGLSFLDRLQRKLGRYHPNWDINTWKGGIRSANNPVEYFTEIIRNMLADPSDVAYYGV